MERKPHSHQSYTISGQLSRIARDLRECSDDFKSSFRPRSPGRLRTSCASHVSGRQLRTCVVGAGLAGLRCAELLVAAGIHVTVLEARDRIGGRVDQDKLLGALVDMGPSWIHGTESNPIVRIASDTHTIVNAVGDETQVYSPSGQPLDQQTVVESYDMIWDVISDAFKFSNQNCSDIRPDQSLKDFFRENLPKRGVSENDQPRLLKIAEMWGSFIGDDWERQSQKWFWLEECLDGENLFVVDTHKKIIDRLAETVRRLADVRLSTKLKRIKTINHCDEDPKVCVTVEKDKEENRLEFDEVVVTIPLGCLKSDAVAFIPPLPSGINHAFQNASISSLEKVYIRFPRAFWESPMSDVSSSLDVDRSRFPTFANFLGDSHSQEQSRPWSLELNTLSNPDIFGQYAMPVLLFSLFGSCARQLTSLINNLSPTSLEYLQKIDDFFRPYYSLLPNYLISSLDCVPNAVLPTNWQNDALAGNGSYTNFKVSSVSGREVTLDKDIEIMRKGLPERGIWFAREHTAPFVALGTTTGAYWSGESVAMRILATNGLQKDPT